MELAKEPAKPTTNDVNLTHAQMVQRRDVHKERADRQRLQLWKQGDKLKRLGSAAEMHQCIIQLLAEKDVRAATTCCAATPRTATACRACATHTRASRRYRASAR